MCLVDRRPAAAQQELVDEDRTVAILESQRVAQQRRHGGGRPRQLSGHGVELVDDAGPHCVVETAARQGGEGGPGGIALE